MDIVKINRAIKSLRPGAQFSIIGDDLIWQDSSSQPSDSEIAIESQRLDDTDKQTAYRSLRAGAYPDIGNQLDMLWHAMESGEIPKSQQFYSAILAVKVMFPKTQEV